MQVKTPPEGYERVVQFNVYLKNGSSNNKAVNNLKYTVRETSEFDVNVQKTTSKDSGLNLDRESNIREVEDIQNFLDKVRSDSEKEEMRVTDSKEETMFRPKRKTFDDQLGEKTQEKTPVDRRKEEKILEARSGQKEKIEPNDLPPNNRPERSNLELTRRKEQHPGENDRALSKDQYLEIFVKPKRGQPSLVYSQEGEPAEIIHRFTPKQEFSQYKDQRDISVSGFKYEEYELPPNFLQPELNDPPQRAKKNLVPNRKDQQEDSDATDEQLGRRGKTPKAVPNQTRPQKEDENDHEYEDIVRERERLSKKQHDLIRVLEDEKNTLKTLVDRLTDTLEKKRNTTPQQRQPVGRFEEDQIEYHQEFRKPSPRIVKPVHPPKEVYVEVPKRTKSKTPPIHKPHNDQSKSPSRRPDDLHSSPAPRKSPFDIKDGRTEWDRKNAYLKQLEKFGRTAPTKQNNRGFEDSDGKYSNENNLRFQRNYERACRECGQTLDKDKFRSQMEAERQMRLNQRYSEHKVYDRSAAYYIEGTLYGPVDPSRVREVRDIIYKP